jgi:hypothetical protein
MVEQNTEKMKWYDVKTKEKFVPKTYVVKVKGGRRFGIAKGPKSGIDCWRVLPSKK